MANLNAEAVPNAIPSAVAGNGLIYCMSGFRGAALFAVKPDGVGDLNGSKAIAWTYHKDTPYVPSPLLYEDRLYFLKGNDATLSVLAAQTGQALLAAVSTATVSLPPYILCAHEKSAMDTPPAATRMRKYANRGGNPLDEARRRSVPLSGGARNGSRRAPVDFWSVELVISLLRRRL